MCQLGKWTNPPCDAARFGAYYLHTNKGVFMSQASVMKQRFFDEGYTLPKCINQGCERDVAVREWKYWSFKTECSSCAQHRKDGRYLTEGRECVIIRKGARIIIHKKSYCENSDGHLGFLCPVDMSAWETGNFSNSLDLDHRDGDHNNNSPENVETICKLCHGRKSLEEGDCNSNKESARKFD